MRKYRGEKKMANDNLAYINPEAINEIETIDENVQEMTEIIKKSENSKISRFFKRTIDIVISLIGVITLIPLTIIVFFLNVINKEKGSIFYVQERIGKNGKLFKMYKYRTMVEDADKIIKKYLENDEDFKKEYRKYKKVKNDPRITKVGKILRKTSLDEFPQFINILKGDMSLVGPRPYLMREKTDMGDYYYYIITMKPGLTGPWQTSGRNNLTFVDRLELDLEYYKNNSLKNDMKYFIKTFAKLIKKEGAI